LLFWFVVVGRSGLAVPVPWRLSTCKKRFQEGRCHDRNAQEGEELNTELKKMKAELDKADRTGAGRDEDEQDVRTEGTQFQRKAQDCRLASVRRRRSQAVEGNSLKKLVARLGVIMGKIGDEGGYTAILKQAGRGLLFEQRDRHNSAGLKR
jgi:Skp family chaperone for outer membrane proteins